MVAKSRGLTAKQARFIDEYLTDLNATQAAIRAGYSARTADKIGPELLGKTRVSETLAARMQARERRTEITQDRVLLELSRLAFFDIRKIYEPDGSLKKVTDLDDDTAAAIAGIEAIEVDTDGRLVVTKKFKFSDKNAALTNAMRHLGMFDDKLNLNVTGSLAERLARARARNGA